MRNTLVQDLIHGVHSYGNDAYAARDLEVLSVFKLYIKNTTLLHFFMRTAHDIVDLKFLSHLFVPNPSSTCNHPTVGRSNLRH
jgi:hypothetical protein